MKNFIYILLLVCIMSQSLDSAIPNTDSILIEKSHLYIDYLQQENWDSAYTMFDSTMKKVFPTQKIEETWNTIKKQIGELEQIVNTEVVDVNGKKTVLITCKFKVIYADIRCVYDENQNIAGFFIAPNYQYSNYQSPNYVDIKKFDEQKITFGKKDWELDAVLSIPHKDPILKTQMFPVVILVHGSGPHDMDETIGPNKPFKDIAWGLASKGVAVFRYNKRTQQHPVKCVELIDDFTVNEEVIDDVIEAINYVANTNDINPKQIFVLGHSLGGMLIPRIALRDNGLKGVVVMAGNARPLQDLLIEQYEYIFNLDAELTQEESQFLDSLKIKINNVNSPNLNKLTPIDELPLQLPAFYWMSLQNYYPATLAKKIKSKIMIMQGERDYQVSIKDYNIWKSELADMKNVEFKLYPKLNHLFMEGDGKSKPEEYFLKGHIPEYVIDDLVNFIKGNDKK